MKITSLAVGSFLWIATSSAFAATMFSTGTGSAVTTADRVATFDSLTTSNIELNNYTEDQLNISVDDVTYVGFDAFNTDSNATQMHYGSGGNYSYVSISTTDAVDMFGVEFLLGGGWLFEDNGYLLWETWKDGSIVSSGLEALIEGTIVGFTDLLGFDELRVAFNLVSAFNFGEQLQAIALDDVKVSLTAPSAVPIPAAAFLFAPALLGFLGYRRKLQARL